MGLSKEMLVEKAFLAAFPGQDQAQKQIYRFELESFVDEALSQLGREVAASQNFQILQRSIALPVAAVKTIPYSRFGSGVGGRGPQVDNGFIKGDATCFAISPERLALTGSPALIRSTFLEWQYLTPDKSVCVGVLPPFQADTEVLGNSFWYVQLRSDSPSNGSVRVLGTSSGTVFTVIEGDIFRFEWDASGNLTITQYDADRTVKTVYAVTGGSISDVAVPAVSMFPATGTFGKVSQGQMGGIGATTPAGGLYRLGLETEYQFVTGSLHETATFQFEGINKTLSWVPSASYRFLATRCDTWYWTLEGEQVVFWPGAEGEALPAESIRITGNIIPESSDLPVELHQRAIDLVVQMATERALRLNTRRTQQVK